jgi:hypothetical protein
MLIWPVVGLLAAAFAAGGCGSGRTIVSSGGGNGGGDGTSTQVTLSRDVQPIFEANCIFAGCHGASAPQLEQDLSSAQKTLASVVNVRSVEVDTLMRVKPGDSANSYLFQKISQDSPQVGTRMPQGFPPLSDTQIQLIQRWIDGGAMP